MQNGTVQPDDGAVRVVVLDFCRFLVVRRVIVRCEMTVRDGVMMVVECARLVDMLRRQRGRKRQKRRDEQHRDRGIQSSHAGIIAERIEASKEILTN